MQNSRNCHSLLWLVVLATLFVTSQVHAQDGSLGQQNHTTQEEVLRNEVADIKNSWRNQLSALNSFVAIKFPKQRRTCEAERTQIYRNVGKDTLKKALDADTKSGRANKEELGNTLFAKAPLLARVLCLAQAYYSFQKAYALNHPSIQQGINEILSDELTEKGMSAVGSQIALPYAKSDADGQIYPFYFHEFEDSSAPPEKFAVSFLDMEARGATGNVIELNRFFITRMTDPAKLGCRIVHQQAKAYLCD